MIRSLYISYNGITEPIVQSQVLPYLCGLSQKDIKFTLLTFEKNKKYCTVVPNLDGIKWYRLKYHKKPSVPATVFDIITGTIYTFFIMIKNRIEVVHARAVIAAIIGFPAAKLLGKKFIFDTRGIDSEEYVDAGLWKKNSLVYKAVAFLENFLTRQSDHTIVLTNRFLEVLKDKHRGKGINFSVIPCAVDTDRFRPEANAYSWAGLGQSKLKEKFVIVYAGSLGTWYMLEEMMDFFKEAKNIFNNAHFLMLTQSDKNAILVASKRKNLTENDITMAAIEYNFMPGYLPQCDAGIFFIRPVFSKLSSSPVKMGEYLASGLPVIINSGIGDTENLVRDNKIGVVVNKFNSESYLKALQELRELIGDRDLTSRCRQAAEKNLSLEKAVISYDGVYKSLLGSL